MVVDGEHNLNNAVSIYEHDLVDIYLVDQKMMLLEVKMGTVFSLKSLGAALQRCDEERFPNIDWLHTPYYELHQ